MNLNKNITITDKNGKQTNYHILCSFVYNENNKKYIIYTDYSKNADNHINVYYAYYDDDFKLKPVKNEKEIALMNNILSDLENELNALS